MSRLYYGLNEDQDTTMISTFEEGGKKGYKQRSRQNRFIVGRSTKSFSDDPKKTHVQYENESSDTCYDTIILSREREKKGIK